MPRRLGGLLLAGALLSAVPLQLSAQMSDGEPSRPPRIRFESVQFDPLAAVPESSSPRLSLSPGEEERARQIIQFLRPLTREETALLKESYGLALDQYVPDFAYLEKAPPAVVGRLRQLPYFRWAGPYQPAYKIDRDIARRSDREADAGEPLILIVRLFPEADLDAVARTAREAGLRVLEQWDLPDYDEKRLKVSTPDPSRAESLARLPEVRWIEEMGRPTLRNGTTAWVIQTNVNNSRTVHNHGLRGEGQIVGHIDGPLDIRHCFFGDVALDAGGPAPGPAHRKIVAYERSAGIPSSAGSDLHGTHTAGILAGSDNINAANADNGNAPAARITHFDLGDYGGNLLAILSQQHADGAHIYSNSWGNDGTTDYTTDAEDIDRFMWDHENDLVIFAATNLDDLRTPENAKNVLAVGATQQNPNQNAFGSGGAGPTDDGRRKPEIFAPGCLINSSRAGTSCTVWNAPSPPFVTVCGTSWATPAVSAAAALARQYYTEGWYPSGTRQPHHAFVPSGSLLKATLLNGTVDMTSLPAAGAGNRYPSDAEGWGRLLLEDSLYFAADPRDSRVWDVRNPGGLFTGDPTPVHTLDVAGPGQPLKITLVWTEPPGTAGTATPVLNNLDLVVTAPDGTVFRGNDLNTTTGFSIANGGTADALNNVEQVIVSNPGAGHWTISVQPTAVNQGPQGYAVVATGDFPEPPVPTGDQDTLVVRLGVPGILDAQPPTEATALTLVTSLAAYVSEVSYNEASLDPLYAEAVLSLPRSFYFHPSHNPLIEMAEEAIAILVAADPGVFDRGAGPDDDIDRIILLLNDPLFAEDLATTGPWPYELPAGLTRRLSVSIQSVFNDAPARAAHGILHQFGLVDLYNHPGVLFAQPHVDGWDNMALPFTGAGTLAWSKERAGWITAHGSTIRYIQRPGPSANVSESVDLSFLTSTGTDIKAVAIGLTPGAASLADEDVFYWIEARSNAAGTVDSVLSESGVLVYHVNEDVPQGEGPVRLLDEALGTASLHDAALETGDTLPTTSSGLSVSVTAESATGRTVQIGFDPPETENDVSITVGDPFWTSPDIWVDSPQDNFDFESGRTPEDRGDQPVTAAENRIYVRVTNPGPGPAFDVTVFVRVSEPYHTVGGQADFNRFAGQLHYDVINDGETKVDFIQWTPDNDGDPHSCIEVEIPNVLNDVNANNNRAQQNVEEVASTTHSPYTPVTYPFGLTNPEATRETLVYFRAEGVPAGWTATLSPKSALLAPGARIDGTLTVQPPDDAPVCTEHRMHVSSWTPRGDTLVPIGGGTVQVDLRNQTLLTLDTGVRPCQPEPLFTSTHALPIGDFRCASITATGCTDPPRPHETIIVRYDHPDGYPIFRQVETDAAGCYSDFLVVVEGGPWKVTAEYPGGDCSGPAVTPGVVTGVPLPTGVDVDGDGLPPGDEPQGDHDRDGIPGIYDSDSDNDDVVDGKEPEGDCDRDGRPNVVDPDSDNDGTPDGRDLTPCGGKLPGGRWGTSFHVGSAHPLGDLDDVADANVYVQLDAGYRLTDRIDLKLLLGLAQLTAESAAGIEHPRWLHGSLAINVLFPSGPGGLVPYLEAGAGIYDPKTGSSEPGFHLGLGARVPIPGPFSLQLGTDFHQVQSENQDRFLTFHLGVLLP